MSVLLITYDYASQGAKTESVLNIVNQYKHIQLAEGSYAIETDEKTRTIFNKILPFLSKNVHLLVVTLIKPFAGPVLAPVSEWLTKHLPED
ncbi:MAG TPA: hypothetical protein VI215_03740 [Bacteroidota bacterium]|jgi:hypothetical protein